MKPVQLLPEATVRELVADIVATCGPRHVDERLVERKDEHFGDDWSYKIVIEWSGERLLVRWTYESVRCMGIDTDQLFAVDVDGTTALVDHRGIEVKPVGPHHEALRALLERRFCGD